jgi:CubicO group peptidase (beta-lactamase class C family)
MDFAQITDTVGAVGGRLVRLDFKGLARLMKINSLFDKNKIVWNFSNMDQLAETTVLNCASPAPRPLPHNPRKLIDAYEFEDKVTTLADYKRDRHVTAFLVLKDGEIAQEEYLQGTDEFDLRVSWSMAKSVVSLLLGALIDKGLVPADALEYKISDHVPMLKGTGYDGPTLKNVLQMSSGVAFNEDYLDYHSDINRMGRMLAMGGSMDEFAASLGKRWEPGTYMHYVSVDTHVIGMMIRALTGREINALTIEHIFNPLGLERDPVFITDSFHEPFILGGLNMTTRDYARIALMVLNNGECDGTQVVSKEWLETSMAKSAPPPSPEKAATPEGWMGYGMQWWLPGNAEGGEVYGIGIYGQYLYINPKYNVVIAQNGGDVNFKDGDGIIEHECLALFRQIAENL